MHLQSFERFQLDNGLTIACAPMPDVRSVSMGLYMGIGARYESAEQSGISHFLEHMLFKGCEGWPTSFDIANEVESRGGYLNASTGREHTSYWIKIGARHWRESLRLLAHMVRYPTLVEDEVELERGVILDEINMYRDVPEELVSQLSNQAVWGEHALGREVAGEPETVSAFMAADLRDFFAQNYRADAAVLTVAGALQADEVYRLACDLFGDWRNDGAMTTFESAPSDEPFPRQRINAQASEQAHLQLAVRSLPRMHPDRFALGILSSLLGDGMISWLWQRVREQKGLAYNIETYMSAYADSGVLGVYGGCDASRLFEMLDEIMDVWRQVQTDALNETEVERFKDYAKGRLELNTEDTGAVASWWGRQLANGWETPLTLDEVLGHIDAVAVADVRRLARELWRPDRLALAYVGPLDSEQRLTDWLAAQQTIA
ncbi:MAG: insulinase family protein [Caldilineales bacterium]|nr:insulinase family protein [Caldilineales bacterium]